MSDLKDIKIILIHGNGGSTADQIWFPYVKSELEKIGLTVISETFPDNVEAKKEIWLPYINKLGADENTIIIGHSSGALAAMRYVENNNILGSVLIGTCFTDLGDEMEKKSGYYNSPWKWKLIKKNQKWSIIFASTDDPYIPISEPRFIKDQLESDYYEYNNKGHFGEDKKMYTFPELVKVIVEKLEKEL
jgi:uncharacterized protein